MIGATLEPGVTVWLTGLSGAGKSTIGTIVAERLRAAGRRVEVLDGDVVRTELSVGLGFSKADRDTNVGRIGWVCELLNRNGVDAVVAAISPYRDARDGVRARVPRFVEVYVQCALDVLTERDPKGLYRRALAGEIEHFTGVSDPYEPPLSPEVVCRTGEESAATSAERVLAVLGETDLVSGGERDAAGPRGVLIDPFEARKNVTPTPPTQRRVPSRGSG